MDSKTTELFRVIFQEAHVIDFDFYEWDRWVRLVVVGGLIDENFNGQGPLHSVDFLKVASLTWKTNHLGVSLDALDQHFQWVIMEFDIQRDRGFYSLDLIGSGPAPKLHVVCGDVRITELDPKIVDRINPQWNRPYCPLARPSFEGLIKSHLR